MPRVTEDQLNECRRDRAMVEDNSLAAFYLDIMLNNAAQMEEGMGDIFMIAIDCVNQIADKVGKQRIRYERNGPNDFTEFTMDGRPNARYRIQLVELFDVNKEL